MSIIITVYSSTLYIGITMIFVFSPYIWKFSFYFHSLTFNIFTAHVTTKLYAKYFTKLPLMAKVITKYNFPILSMFFYIFFFFFFIFVFFVFFFFFFFFFFIFVFFFVFSFFYFFFFIFVYFFVFFFFFIFIFVFVFFFFFFFFFFLSSNSCNNTNRHEI